LSISVVCGSVGAQTPRAVAGRLIGIYDDRTWNPLDSVEVRDLASGQSALTTSTGTVALSFVDTAGSLIRIRKIGYVPQTLFIDNSPGLPPLMLMLVPVAKQLPAVVTIDTAPKYSSPRLTAFEERRKTGFGYFVPEAQIRRDEDRPLAQLLRTRIPPIEVREVVYAGQRITIATLRRGSNSAPCQPDIYLDGIAISANADGATLAILGKTRSAATAAMAGIIDLNQFQLNTIAAIEFHNPGDMPPEFNRTGSGCGALFLWTRER
jgi:hypothetical protein